MFLKLLLSSSLTIIVAAAFLTDDQIIKISQEELNRHSNDILPHLYDMIVTHIEENILVCNCIIRTEIKHPTSSILLYSSLHVKNINLSVFYSSYFMNDTQEEIIYASVKSMYDVEKNIVKYIFPNDVLPGYYNVKLVYNITEDTGLKSFYKRDERQWYVDHIGIQHMIPSLPESLSGIPFKPIYNIIIEHYQNYTVLLNPLIQTIERNDKNMTKTYFHTFIKPSYLLFINRINLSFMPGTNESVRVNMWCRMHCEFAHQFAGNITTYLFDKWKRLNQTLEINHIALPDFQNESIINLGLILYREADIIYNDNVDSVATKIKVARFMAHKIIQECSYYENPLWSLSSLLNEAIVAFLGLYVTNQALPRTQMMNLFVVQIQQESLHFDTEYNTSLYNTPFNISFEHYSFIKVSSILRKFQRMVTTEIFWQSIRIYVKDNKPTFNYFGEIVKNLSSIQISTGNLSTISQLIISLPKQKYCDVKSVKLERDYNQSIRQLKVTIYSNYYIPESFHIKFGNIVIHNTEQSNYYRVNYEIENWQRIAEFLHVSNYKRIHVLNRAQIIDDAFHLMITNQLNSTVFWNITKYLSRETDYIAWYPMFKALEYLSNIFLFREQIYLNIKSLRMEAAKWACNLDDRICIKAAQNNLNRHLADPEKNTLLPWWKEWTYCQGLKLLNYSLSNSLNEDSHLCRVYRLEKEKFETKILKYLSCPEDSQFIKAALNPIKNDSITSIMFLEDFSDKDYINYFLFTIAKHARNPVVLDIILEKLENIRPRQVSEHVTFTVIINHVYSVEQLIKISKLAESYRHMTNLPIYIYISQHISNIQNKIRRRIFEIKCQQNYFQNFVEYQ
ncbi:glutamyl aminopeptidase-like isoform X2 [Camponotus floridanus]|uniref:glutamyl aminopeptidase-like isoform X2 n=2 Tax=Camponotus floridanus TaxID=104421 RepID=UPI000DC6CDE5|nr:glutamyl aminopeptidase-like isoform X2 [Camponotus floridanus]